jgi:G protein-coupled receptor kinase
MMELENIVANTVYIKAREGTGSKDKGRSRKWRQMLKFPNIYECRSLREEIDKTYENIVEEQPIGRRLFVRFCSRDEKLKNSIDFEAELEDFDKLLEEERSVAAQKIWDKFLSPQSQCRIEQISDEMADEVQSEISNDLSRNVFDNCRRYV